MAYSNRTVSYDAAEVNVTFFGIVQGVAKGTWVEASRDENSYEDDAGADGEVVRSKSNDRRGSIIVRLLQSSQQNAIWSALVALDENSPSGDGIGPILVNDNSGTTVISAEKAWINKFPTVGFSERGDQVREWTIRCANLVMFAGGN